MELIWAQNNVKFNKALMLTALGNVIQKIGKMLSNMYINLKMLSVG